MADTIRLVEYFYITAADKSGEACARTMTDGTQRCLSTAWPVIGEFLHGRYKRRDGIRLRRIAVIGPRFDQPNMATNWAAKNTSTK